MATDSPDDRPERPVRKHKDSLRTTIRRECYPALVICCLLSAALYWGITSKRFTALDEASAARFAAVNANIDALRKEVKDIANKPIQHNEQQVNVHNAATEAELRAQFIATQADLIRQTQESALATHKPM